MKCDLQKKLPITFILPIEASSLNTGHLPLSSTKLKTREPESFLAKSSSLFAHRQDMSAKYVVNDESTHTLDMSMEALLVTINCKWIPSEPMFPFNLDMPIEMLLGTP